ncbi:hypothetical protein FRC02_010667 [Tulasnella sp. 418]|nr:hypothetical protein FRC02_010667 [Tulasnella sp. 418]
MNVETQFLSVIIVDRAMAESERKNDAKRLARFERKGVQLPLEIHVIISQFCDQPTLATLSRVNKVMKAVSQPLLYKKINLLDKNKNRIESLVRTLVISPVLGPMVLELSIDIEPLAPRPSGLSVGIGSPLMSDLQLLSNMFCGLKNLRVLIFNGPPLYDGSVLQHCSSTFISSFKSDMNIGIKTLEWLAKQSELLELNLPYTETVVDSGENVLDPVFQITSFPKLESIGGLIYTVGSIVQGSEPPLKSVTFFSETQSDKDMPWMYGVLITISAPLETVKINFPLNPGELVELFEVLGQHHSSSIKKLDLVISSIPRRTNTAIWTKIQQHLNTLTSLSELHLPLSKYVHSDVDVDVDDEEDSQNLANICMEACPSLLIFTAPDLDVRWRGDD